jgi:hypothetical protein
VLNPSSSQPGWQQDVQTGMQRVRQVAGYLRGTPAGPKRDEFMRSVLEQGNALRALALQGGLDGVALDQARQPLVESQARFVADLSDQQSKRAVGDTIQLNTKNTELAQAAQTNAIRETTEGTRNIIDTTGRNLREGVQTQADAYAKSVAPVVLQMIREGTTANAANTQAFIGGPGEQAALPQLIGLQDRANEINERAFNRANPAWAPLADTGLRLAGLGALLFG